MRRYFFLVLCLIPIGCLGQKPVDLLEVFRDAAENDPTYQQQVATFQAAQQAVPQNFAALLPQVTLTAAIASEFHSLQTLPSNGTFSTNSYDISATQTIFNYTQFMQLEQARYSVRAAFATLTAQQQDLMSRTTKAFLDVLQAYELLRFTEDQNNYINTQLAATQTLFEHKEATITDLDQATGAAELISSDLYTAKIRLYDAVQTLSQITSFRYRSFYALNDQFPLNTPHPHNMDMWTQSANRRNWLLCAARLNIKVAREALEAAKGGFYPNISAALELDNGAVPNQILTDTMQKTDYSYGLNANWNFYQGGLTLAQVKIAQANINQASAAMRQQYLQTMAETRRAYNTILLGVPRVKSLRQALASNTNALLHAQESYRAGQTTITEILQIQYQLYTAQRQYAEFTYNYLYNIVLLKQAQGTLSVRDLARINRYLQRQKTFMVSV